MNPLDIVWLSSIGAAFVMLVVVTLIFWQTEGRAKVYLSALLAAFAIHALGSLVTALANDIVVGWGFKATRTITWSLIAFSGLCMVLYQLKIINGVGSKN